MQIIQIGLYFSHLELLHLLQGQLLVDVFHDRRGGGGGEREPRHPRPRQGPQLAELEVVGPEVVPPLRDAVRLVDDEVSELPKLDQLLEDALQGGASIDFKYHPKNVSQMAPKRRFLKMNCLNVYFKLKQSPKKVPKMNPNNHPSDCLKCILNCLPGMWEWRTAPASRT